VRARQDATSPGAPPPPSALRPVLRFTRLPTQAVRTVLQVLERDETFRARVAEGADEAELDRGSWLFLTRPEGWSDELALLRSAASEEQAEESASRQEQSAERRLAQVEETLDRVRAELRDARTGLVTAEGAAATERAARLRLDGDREALTLRVAEVEQERARAVRSLKEVESRATTRLAELRGTR
jgi:chromosome segregation ATPase